MSRGSGLIFLMVALLAVAALALPDGLATVRTFVGLSSSPTSRSLLASGWRRSQISWCGT